MMTVYARAGKRLFDVTAGLLIAAFTLPLQALIVGLVRVKLGSPVLFSQERPGRNGKPFRLRKFRTMTDERDAAGALLPDEDRLPPFGMFLRSTSLDELPEIYNVVRGHMSLVGPRPLLMRYLPLYTPEQARRHQVRPGLTGWAQVNGRNAVSWEKKFALDVWYVDNVSLRLDMQILWRTLLAVLRRDGISSEGHVTAPAFEGGPPICPHPTPSRAGGPQDHPRP